MSRVLLTGWNTGFRKVAFTKLIQSQTNSSLKEAVGQTERMLDGGTVAIEFQTLDQARAFAAEAQALGAIARIEVTRPTAPRV